MSGNAKLESVREQRRLPRERLPQLSKDPWRARLSDLLHDCAASAPAEQVDRIREAQHLLLNGPAGAVRSPGAISDRRTVETLLAAGAHESAVMMLIGADTAFMLSRGANGTCLASAVLPDGSEEVVAEGSTLALALLAAYLSSLIADGDPVRGEAAALAASASLRLN
jgi:hypothetical protein